MCVKMVLLVRIIYISEHLITKYYSRVETHLESEESVECESPGGSCKEPHGWRGVHPSDRLCRCTLQARMHKPIRYIHPSVARTYQMHTPVRCIHPSDAYTHLSPAPIRCTHPSDAYTLQMRTSVSCLHPSDVYTSQMHTPVK